MDRSGTGEGRICGEELDRWGKEWVKRSWTVGAEGGLGAGQLGAGVEGRNWRRSWTCGGQKRRKGK